MLIMLPEAFLKLICTDLVFCKGLRLGQTAYDVFAEDPINAKFLDLLATDTNPLCLKSYAINGSKILRISLGLCSSAYGALQICLSLLLFIT